MTNPEARAAAREAAAAGEAPAHEGAPRKLGTERSAAALGYADELLSRGDHKAAIAELVDAHGDAVFSFCARMLGDRVVAEDVVQRVYLEAYRDIERHEGRQPLASWLITIARNRCLDELKSRMRRERQIVSHEPSGLESVDAPSARHEQSQLIAALEDCLQHLNSEVRATVLLRFQSGMTYHEMSSVIGASPAVLQLRVQRALPVLKRCLEAKGFKP
jgi:RNA polymerase sigma-70 factor (ECF subfamily)